MQSLMKPEARPKSDFLLDLPPDSRLPRLDLAVDWESPWTQFRTSVQDFLSGPRPLDGDSLPPGSVLRARWIQGKFPVKGCVASGVWHIAAVVLLLLPIWGFLPAPAHNLAPVQIELSWYLPPLDLPPISLPAAIPRPRAAAKAVVKTDSPRGADAYNPRQMILSIPVRATHPRQTLIQPDAPPLPPKIVPQLPNIVQWAAPQPKARPVLPPTESAPLTKQRANRDVAAPDIASAEKNPSPLNIVSTPAVNLQPRLPVIPTSARAEARSSRKENAAEPAPEINASAGNDTDLRRVIALSATPAPPAPLVSVPQGNLAARISISPDGEKPGAPASSARNAAAGSPGGADDSGSGPEAGKAAGTGGASGANSLPAAVSISGPNAKPGNGGIAPSGQFSGKLNLKPALPSRPSGDSRTSPVARSSFDPNLPPEKILSGKEVYTMHVNSPNFTSSSGSWIMNFAQLDENADPPFKPKGVLSGPVATHEADPKYPPDLIAQHVQGQVILYAIIRKDGSIDSIQLVRSLEPQLDRNAIEALAQWKFRPGTRDGVPVDIEAVVYIPFLYQSP